MIHDEAVRVSHSKLIKLAQQRNVEVEDLEFFEDVKLDKSDIKYLEMIKTAKQVMAKIEERVIQNKNEVSLGE